MTKLKTLERDGMYSSDDTINGYSDPGQQRKERFLRDARALLKKTREFMARFGWTECDIRINPAGVAVSGDVHADYWNPDDPLHIVYCTIGASAIAFGARKDGVTIMARQEQRAPNQCGGRKQGKVSYRTSLMGPNQYIDPGMNSQELAAALFKIAGMKEDAEKIRMLQGCAYHSRTAGVIPVPSPIIKNSAEAELVKEAVGTVIDAARADTSVHNGEQTLGEARTDARQLTLFEALQDEEGASVRAD